MTLDARLGSACGVLLAGLLAGCSGADATPTRLGDGPLDEAAVERLLTKHDIVEVGGQVGGLSANVEDLLEIARLIDSSQPDGVEAWVTSNFVSSNGPRLLLTVKRFASADLAHEALDVVETGAVFESMADPIGDRSALSPANSDVGAAVTFVVGRNLVSLQLPVTADGATLLDDRQLTSLALIVAGRL